MDKLGSKPLNQLTIEELRVELQQTRNALSDERQKRLDLQGAYDTALAVEKELQERERPRPAC